MIQEHLSSTNFNFNLYSILQMNQKNNQVLNNLPDEENEYDHNEDKHSDEDDENELGWSQTSRERNSYETDEDYQERMEDLDNYMDGF